VDIHEQFLVKAFATDLTNELRGEFDWRQEGKSMYHWISPPAIPEGFEDAMGEIAEEKLQEALKRTRYVEKVQKKYNKMVTEISVSTSVKSLLLQLLAAHYEEVFIIQPWIRYYVRLAEKAKTYTPPIKEDKITDADIVRAKEYPLDRLITQHLYRSGRDFICHCPFHEERTPSFHIYLDDNRYFCFGCGKWGDAITYVMETEKVDFLTAVRRLQ
jgi:hypothetical protein